MTEPNGSGQGLTVKELILQMSADVRSLDGKLDNFIASHTVQHAAESVTGVTMAADPEATPAGRTVARRLEKVETRAENHERVLNRVYGALALVLFLLGGNTVYSLLRLSGHIT